MVHSSYAHAHSLQICNDYIMMSVKQFAKGDNFVISVEYFSHFFQPILRNLG